MQHSKIPKTPTKTLSKTPDKKVSISPTAFDSSRLASCTQVYIRNGQAVAVPFPMKLTGYKAKNSYVNARRSSEIKSLSHDMFKVRPEQHAGMRGKPLQPYHATAQRNRMPTPTVIMPYKNASNVRIGNSESPYKRQYITTHQNSYKKTYGKYTNNQGIISDRIKWQRHLDLL